jgi:PPOX class probable F420-dependent enzyme
MEGMDVSAAIEFLRSNHRVVLATLRADGGPQMSPVVQAVDDEGRVMISTREASVKVRNLRRNGRAWLCGLNDGFFGAWVQAEGPAEIVSLPEAMPLLVDYYRSVAGEHPDWDDYRAAMEREGRCVIRITVDRAGPNVSG